MKNKINTKRIFEYLKKSNMSKSVFCKKCGISYSTFQNLMAGGEHVRILAVYKIARFLKVQLCEMFV